MKQYMTVRSVKGREIDVSYIKHFTLPTVLDQGKRIAVDTERGSVTLMVVEDGLPKQTGIVRLTPGELRLALPLLEYADMEPPTYCPHEILHALQYFNNTSEASIQESQRRLYQAHECGVVEDEIRPVRNALSRVRFKLRLLGIDVTSVLSTGYMLI